jgi:hypothetical protein
MSASVERGPAGDTAAVLDIPDSGRRDDLAGFIARVVQLDAASVVRLRADGEQVVAWASTPFEVLATRAVRGGLQPADLTVAAGDLLAALAVVRHAQVDPGSRADDRWRAELPPPGGWRVVAELPVAELTALADEGIALARAQDTGHGHGGPGGVPPGDLLDRTVHTAEGNGIRAAIPLRCLFALSGMGYLGAGAAADPVRVSATEDAGWVRLDTRDGAVVRRRRALLPLVF